MSEIAVGFRKGLKTMQSWHRNDGILKGLRDALQNLDKDGDGKLSMSELLALTGKQVQHLVRFCPVQLSSQQTHCDVVCAQRYLRAPRRDASSARMRAHLRLPALAISSLVASSRGWRRSDANARTSRWPKQPRACRYAAHQRPKAIGEGLRRWLIWPGAGVLGLLPDSSWRQFLQ